MINFQDLVSQYPVTLQPFKRNILREYLQYKILSYIFTSTAGQKLSFIGGTALRIIHNNSRFSQDLDFDNFLLAVPEFEDLIASVQKSLESEGYQVETRNVYKGAYRCYIRIPELLFQLGLSPLEEEKILIQLDTTSTSHDYQPETIIINKFDVFTPIRVTPPDILLAQKFITVLERKTTKGRDFYDIVFLLSKTKPNYTYLNTKINVNTSQELRNVINSKITELNFVDLAKDVQSFLFYPKDKNKVELFPQFFQTCPLD